MSELTHLDETGSARMVKVDHKDVSARRAIARGVLSVRPQTLKMVQEGLTPKGDVFSTARIAGIMAAKETSRLIPLCHPLKITGVEIDFHIDQSRSLIEISASVEAVDRTGVEMEALTAASVTALTLYDMLKAVDQHMVIGEIKVVQKRGGRRDFDITGASNQPENASEQPSAESSPWRPIRVVGKNPTSPLAETSLQETALMDGAEEPVMVTAFSELSDAHEENSSSSDDSQEGLLTSTRPLLQLLTPIEPIPALKQETSSDRSSSDEQGDQEEELASVWDESIIMGLDEVDEEPLSRPEITDALIPKVKEVSLSYPPLRRFIIDRPVECAYLLGYLSPEFSQRTRAFILEEEVSAPIDLQSEQPRPEIPSRVRSLLFIYSGLTLPTVWTYGSDLDVEAILRAKHAELPRRLYLNIEDHHVRVIRALYHLRNRRALLRMGLHRDHYRQQGETREVVPLSHRDTGNMMALFQRYYPDHLFEPAQLDLGLYCGVKQEDTLVSVAGLHLLNPEHRVSAIGSIVTDVDFRGRGYASQCVQHILDQLFEQIDHVALNVAEDNAPAIHCYQKFGFQTSARLIEAQARLR